jgi:CDP-2,3-bis-(O-geranylgeranyl)-sn-glycerol synthase
MTATRLLELAYFMLPAYLANMAPPFVKFWPGWNRPISQKWLGAHKTVMGVGLGVANGELTAFAQSRIEWFEPFHTSTHWFALGFAQGFGAMGGDLIKSFFNWRMGIPPGGSWIPADQLDFPIGILLLLSFWIRLGWPDVVAILAMSFVGVVAVNQISFRLGIRDTKW